MAWEPLVALLPDHDPEAMQSVARFEDQVRVDPLPLLTVLGLADRATVGADGVVETETVADCWALPPGPVQVNV